MDINNTAQGIRDDSQITNNQGGNIDLKTPQNTDVTKLNRTVPQDNSTTYQQQPNNASDVSNKQNVNQTQPQSDTNQQQPQNQNAQSQFAPSYSPEAFPSSANIEVQKPQETVTTPETQPIIETTKQVESEASMSPETYKAPEVQSEPKPQTQQEQPKEELQDTQTPQVDMSVVPKNVVDLRTGNEHLVNVADHADKITTIADITEKKFIERVMEKYGKLSK